MTIVDQVDRFMQSSLTSCWIGDEYIDIYVRKGIHRIDGRYVNTFDVANIQQLPENRNKGYFRAFMQKVETLDLPVYVESIHNPALVQILQKNKYTIIDQDGGINAIKWNTEATINPM